MSYSFDDQLKVGERGEERLDRCFSRFYQISPVPMELQRLGVDRIFNNKGIRFTVEYKTDLKACSTRNFFLETEVDSKPGWLFSSVAQVVIYYIPPDAYVLNLLALRQDIHNGFLKGEESKPIPNVGYQARGILVPITLVQWPLLVTVEKVGPL